jgi:hypothetical protein
VTLFPTPSSKPKARPTARDRAEYRIPTGAPRLVESSTDRAARSSTEAWESLLDAVRRSSMARLTLLSGRSGTDRVSCPWALSTDCVANCRCGGSGTVTVEFLRKHYATLTDDIELLARPMPARRSPR